jgi:hypothetical protein
MSDDLDATHRKTAGRLEVVCLCFIGLGVLLPIVYASPLFAPYRSAVADAIGDTALVDGPTARLAVGITGGSIAGKWLAPGDGRGTPRLPGCSPGSSSIRCRRSWPEPGRTSCW